jgi:hypothetical protein
MEKRGGRKTRYIIRPVYVSAGPQYCLVFDQLCPVREYGNVVPNAILEYQGSMTQALRSYLDSAWQLATPYFAEPEDVTGYGAVSIAV